MAVGADERSENDVLKDRERAAVMAVALASLPNEDEVREAWLAHNDMTFPSLAEALDDLQVLTYERRRCSQRSFVLRLLANGARVRGTTQLAEAGEALTRYVETSVEEGARMAEAREAAARKAAALAAEQVRQERPKRQDRPKRGGFLRRAPQAEAVLRAEALPQADPPPTTGILRSTSDTLEVAAPPAPGPPLVESTQSPEAQQVMRAFEAAAAPQDEETAWEVFSRDARSALELTDDELNLPVCDDTQIATINGHTATRVITWFTTDRPASDFSRWTDARFWSRDCTLFYESVTPDVTLSDAMEEYDDHLFTEIVRFGPTKTLTTKLRFTRKCNPPNRYALHFDLPQDFPNHGETADIAVDRGVLMAKHDPDDPNPRSTRITAEKAILFKDPAMASWPSLSCDLFWMELTITVALGCALHDQ